MLTLYTWHDDDDDVDVKGSEESQARLTVEAAGQDQRDLESGTADDRAPDDVKSSKADDLDNDLPAVEMDDTADATNLPAVQPRKRQQDPLIFLYYSTILTGLTVIVALVIGIIQLLSLILNVAEPTGKFWDGVAVAGEYYDVIGGSICGLFLVVGVGAIFFYGRFKRYVYATRERNLGLREARRESGREGGIVEESPMERAVSPELSGKKAPNADGLDNHELLYSDSPR